MSDLFPQSAVFGSLLRDPDIRDLLSDASFTRRMLEFERAWTEALSETELVDPETADRALVVIDDFTPDMRAVGAGTDRDGLPVPALVKQLKAAAGDAADAIHTGATSQDVIDTAIVLSLLDVLELLELRLRHIADQLADLSQMHGAAPLMGRTRMQAANPITVDDRLSAWVAPLEKALSRLPALRTELARLQYGGAVGDRAGADGKGDAIAASLARTLGLSAAPCWHSDRSAFVSFGHWLVLVSGSLGKIGQDMALMAQQGVEEVKLKGGGGSSAMPHKQNPVRAEVLVTLARYVAGQQGILGGALIHEQERSGSAWTLEWLILPQMSEATGTALRHCSDLLDQVTGLGDATPSDT